MKYGILLSIISFQVVFGQGRQDFQVHSHNDYYQNVPFWRALSAGATSIEADVFLKDDALYVAHSTNEITADKSLEMLYIKPLQESLVLRKNANSKLQLLIDIKSEPYSTLAALTKLLEGYLDLTNDPNVRFVISGNRPTPEEYPKYPDFIKFDYQSLAPITDENVRNKVALVSLSFTQFSSWNGLGRLTKEDSIVVSNTIEKAHALNKPFRFWGSPDTKTAWQAFRGMEVDFINTDKPYDCFNYLKTLDYRTVRNRDFRSKVYTPTFQSDAVQKPVKNIILMIGDGNGLAQITAAQQANKGNLSLTQLKSIGLVKTQSADDFTTDSAAGATAMATGTKTNNRAIGVDRNGNKVPNLTEILTKKEFSTGIITTDNIAGATPSSFYAHQRDRSQVDEILDDLVKSQLNLIISMGAQDGIKNQGFAISEGIEKISTTKLDHNAYFNDTESDGDMSSDPGFLASATKHGLIHLNQNKSPFFILIEGAKIDSYGHKNSIKGIINEGIAFDRAVSEALRFADENQNTLVIITADHETSGLSLPHGSNDDYSVEGDFASTDHSGSMVPLFAYGPQSEEFSGVYENTEIFKKIMLVLGIER